MERSDSAESHVLFFQTEVPLLFSVSLLWGKTNASSSEPVRAHKQLVNWVKGHFTGNSMHWFDVLYAMDKGHTQAVALGSRVRGKGARAGSSCVFVFLQTLYSHLISTVPVTVYPTV